MQRVVIALLLVSLSVITLASSCDKCLNSEMQLVLDASLEYDSRYRVNLESTIESLCGITYEKTDDKEECTATASEFVIDVFRDMKSESEHANDIKIISTKSICAEIQACTVSCCQSDYDPEQIHLSVTLDPSVMVVSWVTLKSLGNPSVKYYQAENSSYEVKTPADITTYRAGGWKGKIYNSTLTGLLPSTKYTYQIEGEYDNQNHITQKFNFTTDMQPSAAPLKPRSLLNASTPHEPGTSASVIAYIADLSVTVDSYETTSSIATLVHNQTVQLVVQGGDLPYADGEQSQWDQFMRMIHDYGKNVAVMSAPGNHENYHHFAAYNHRFFMPNAQSGSSSQQYFSFNYEKIHFVSWSYEQLGGLDLRKHGRQRKWLENDLAQANLERDVRPWVVLFGHRPFYCSSDSSDCTSTAEHLRNELEGTINEYHVDVVLQAHKHNYERTYPVYNSQETSKNYTNPAAPMYYVVGVGGREQNSDFDIIKPSWSAYRDDAFGYLLLSSPDENSLEMIYMSKSYTIHDSATIERTKPITDWTFKH